MWKLESGVTRLAGVIKSKLRKARQNMAANHYQCGEFFRRRKLKQLENPELDSARDNLETDSGDYQSDVLSELASTKRKVSSSSD